MSQQKITSFIGKKRLLTMCGCSSAALGLFMLSLSLATNNWITTYERLTKYNVTTIVAINSGLWKKCWRAHEITGITKETLWNDNMKEFPDDIEKNCSFISYFKDKSKSTGELKAPEGILYEMRTAAIFPIIGFVSLLIGCSTSALSFCDVKLKRCIFVASGFFVLSGVFLLIGIVLYVGSISQAFDIKNNDLDNDSQYYFDYGMSFYLSVLAFVFTEFSGVFCIYLYLAKQKHLNKDQLLFEETKPTKNVDGAINCLNFNRHRPWVAIDDRSHISPLSQTSTQSYQFNRRYSDQVLLKLQQTDTSPVLFQPQYAYSTPQHDQFSRYSPGDSLGHQFISEYRADQPSPLLPFVTRVSTPNNIPHSPHVVFYNDDNHVSSPELPLVSSLILTHGTYFDSPMEEPTRNMSVTSEQFQCSICHNSIAMCTCDSSLFNHHRQINTVYDHQPLIPISKELLPSESPNTLNHVSKPRKITAV